LAVPVVDLVYLFFPHPSPRIFGSASTTMPEPLEIEQRMYEARQQELLAHQGKYVVIKSADVLGCTTPTKTP